MFKENAAGLGEKLVVVLWQLPPTLTYKQERLTEFCELLRNEYSEKRHVFEFRHESWLQEECYDILASDSFALCIPLAPEYPRVELMTSPYSYMRFHSGETLGNSCYTNEELSHWATKIRTWLTERDIYIYFNNDSLGFAIDNAKKLRNYIK